MNSYSSDKEVFNSIQREGSVRSHYDARYVPKVQNKTKKTTVGKNFVLYDMYDINKASSLLNMSDSMNYR